MEVKRLGPNPNAPDTIEINYNCLSFRKLLKVLEKLAGVKLLWKKSWIFTDDYWAEISYKGHKFSIDSPFVDYWIHREPACAVETFNRIIEHLESYKPSWLRQQVVKISELRRKSELKKSAANNRLDGDRE